MFNDENADLCESRWSVFLFFFSMEGREEEKKKGKIRATRDQGDKRKEKKNEGTRDDRAMIESERTIDGDLSMPSSIERGPREERERKEIGADMYRDHAKERSSMMIRDEI